MREPGHRALSAIDPVAPSMARVYAILLGDEDYGFPPDRQAVQRLLDIQPTAADFARENRAWVGRAVREIASQGVGQIIDLGAGLPPSALFRPVHEVAREIRADVRVAYADNDPVVYDGIAREAERLDGVSALLADLRDPAQIMQHLTEAGFDIGQPVGLIFGAVLHFLPADQARTIVWRYTDLICPGSYIAVSVARTDRDDYDRFVSAYRAAQTWLHGREEVAAWMSGLDLIPPGMTRARDWHPESGSPVSTGGWEIWCGLGRKPACTDASRQASGVQAEPAAREAGVPTPGSGWTYADRLLGLLSGRWAHIVLRHLPADPPGARPAELLAAIHAAPGQEHKTLSKQILLECLARMTDRGLAERTEAQQQPHPVTFYRLTESGRDALAALRRLAGPTVGQAPPMASPALERVLAKIDPGRPSIARVYDYLLGGKDNFQADRDTGDKMIAHYPGIVAGMKANRAFLGRAVQYLAREAGISQFLDIGTGLPSSNNTHEVAQRVRPEARVVYVDNDPIVLSHAKALLTSTPQGACAYVDADLRDTAAIIRAAAATLDLRRPVAVCLLMILQFIPDQDDPWQIVRNLMDAVPRGSYLTIVHPASDIETVYVPGIRQLTTRMAGTQATPRGHGQVARFFDGLDMITPGLVQVHRWRPASQETAAGEQIASYAGIGRKP